jgi:uncharacterized protein with FMN-binding domain
MRRVLLAVVSTVTGLVMLLSFKSHSVVAVSATASAAPAAVSTQASSSASATPAPTATTGASTTTGATTKTVTGDTVETRWGPVQVTITVTSGKITSAVAVQYPTSNGRDQEINAYAVPVLEQETVKAGSASIDMVSGATYTSNGYITSLQSALDKA